MHRNYSEKQKAQGLKPEYNKFIRMLRDRYVNRDKVDQDRKKLLSLKMSKLGNDLYRYNDEFEALVSSIGYGDLTAAEMLGCYKHGLPDSIVEEIVKHNARTVEDATRVANNYFLRRGSESSVNIIAREINRQNNSYNSSNRRMGRPSNFKQ